MPDPLELAVLLVLGAVAAGFVARPLLRDRASEAPMAEDAVVRAALRRRIALEALQDVEADRRAGSLDDETYARLRAEAEADAAATLAALEHEQARTAQDDGWRTDRLARRAAALAGTVLVAATAAGYVLPPPIGLAAETVDLHERALQRALARVEANRRDPQALSQLADALLATGDPADRARGAEVLIALIGEQPENVDAYRRLITAYIEAGAYRDAAAATDSLAEVAPADAPDVPFFRGLIARAEGRSAEAVAEFERFLELAPDDPRAVMVQRLIEEARDPGDG